MRCSFGVRRSVVLLILHVLSTAAQSLICGTTGDHDEVDTSWYMSNAFYGGLTSFTLCSSYCLKDPRCLAFRYSYWSDADSQYCEFFDVPIFTNFTADSTSPYYYYDRGCAFPPFEDPVTVTSTSTPAAITITSTRLATLTSTLPVITTTSTVAAAAIITTRTATSISTSTQTLPAQIRTVTASYTATATAHVSVTSTQTLPAQVSTVYYAVTQTKPAQTYYLTATRTATVTAQVQITQAPVTRFSTRTILSTTTNIQYLRTITTTRRVC